MQEEEQKGDLLKSSIEKIDDRSSIDIQPEQQIEGCDIIEESSIVQQEITKFQWLDEEQDEKMAIINHFLALEGQAKEHLGQSQLEDMINSNSRVDLLPQIDPFAWKDDFENIEEYMKLMSQPTFDIEDRLMSRQQQLNLSFPDIQLVLAKQDSFFMLLEYLNSKLSHDNNSQKLLPFQIFISIEQCAENRKKGKSTKLKHEREILDQKFKLFRLSMAVRWTYKFIRITQLKKEEGIKSEVEIDYFLKQPIDEEQELKQLKIDGKSRTRCDRLMSLQRLIQDHHQYTEFLKDTLNPSFDPEVQLNPVHFSLPFNDQACIQRKIKNIEDLQTIIQTTQEQIEQITQDLKHFQNIEKQASRYEILKYLKLEHSNSTGELSSAKIFGNTANELELAKSDYYRANDYLRENSLELHVQRLIYFMRLKDLKKKDDINLLDVNEAINNYIEKINVGIKQDEQIYGKYQAEKIIKSIKNAVADFQYSSNLPGTIDKLKNSLSSMNHFNFKQVSELFLKNQSAMNAFENENSPNKVVIMFGRTGLGKSTAIQYLGGENLEYTEVSGLRHIGVKYFQNPLLEKFTNSPFSKSETSFCSSIELQHERKRYLFCDTPGFGDTRGAEIDFSNTLGIFRALEKMRYSKTVIPIFFFSIDGLSAGGGRGDSFRKDINQIYLQIFQDEKFEECKNQIMFFFTRGVTHGQTHQMRLDQVKSCIKDIRRNENNSYQDPNYDSFVREILDQIDKENRVFIIDPLDIREIEKIFDSLKAMRGIDSPNEVFKFTNHPDTTRKLKDQIQFNSQLICNSIIHSRYEIAQHYFNEINDFQSKVQIIDEARIYLENAKPLLQSQINEFFECFQRYIKFNIRKLEGEDLTKLEFLFNRLLSMEVLKMEETNLIVFSKQEIQAKVIEIVDNIFKGEVQQAGIDDEKWELVINKTRVISESVLGFLAEKYQQIYSLFMSKVNNSAKEFKSSATQEFEKYFLKKDLQVEEAIQSAAIYSLSLKASQNLLEKDSHILQCSLNSFLDEFIDQISTQVDNDTCIFCINQENDSIFMIQSQFKYINQAYLDQVKLIIDALSIFEVNYREITQKFTQISNKVASNIKKYIEQLIQINRKLLQQPSQQETLKLFESQIQMMFSTFSFASQDMNLDMQFKNLFYGREQLIIDQQDKIIKELQGFYYEKQTLKSINQIKSDLGFIYQMKREDEICVQTIQNVRQKITELINDIVQIIQNDVINQTIKLTNDQDEIKNIIKVIKTQYWYRQLQSCFKTTFPDWLEDLKFPEPVFKEEIIEILEIWTNFICVNQLIEEDHAITIDTYMLTFDNYFYANQLHDFAEILQQQVVFLKDCIEHLSYKCVKIKEQCNAVIQGQNKVLFHHLQENFNQITEVIKLANRPQILSIDDLQRIDTNVSQISKILELLSNLKKKCPIIYEKLTINEANDYNLLQILENKLQFCQSGDYSAQIYQDNLNSQFTRAIKDLDLIKMHNAGVISEKLAEMDYILQKTGEKNLKKFKFNEFKIEFASKNNPYEQIEKKAQELFSRKNQKTEELDKSYVEINLWLMQLDQIIKHKEIIKDVQKQLQIYTNIQEHIKKVILFHNKEIEEKYLRYDAERMFDVQVIENVKVHFIKLEKMNKYLKSFIPKQLNCSEKLRYLIRQVTKQIQNQRNSILTMIFSKRNYNDGLQILDRMIESLNTLDMTFDECNFNFDDNANNSNSRNNSVASYSLKIVQSNNSVYKNSQNEYQKLQGTFPFLNEFKSIQDKVNEEIQNLQKNLQNKDADFLEIIKKQQVAKIVDSFTEMKYQSKGYSEAKILVRDIGKTIKKKTIMYLDTIQDEKYSVEDEDSCQQIILKQREKLKHIKEMLQMFPEQIKSELSAKILLVANHINDVEKKLENHGLQELKQFASSSIHHKNIAFQDLCDKIYAQISRGNFLQVVQKTIFKLEALQMQIGEELDETSKQKLISIILEIIIHISKVEMFFSNLFRIDSNQECEFSESYSIQVVESLIKMNEKLHSDFIKKSLNDQNFDSDHEDRIGFTQKLSSIFINIIQEVIRLEDKLQNTDSLVQELNIFIALQKVDNIINLLNFNLEQVLSQKDISELLAPPNIWQFKELTDSLTNLGQLNLLQKKYQALFKYHLVQILSYQPSQQQYSFEELQEFAQAFQQINEAQNVLGPDFIINDKLNLGNLRENTELHLSNILNDKLEEILDRRQKVQMHLNDVKFDENLKYLFPISIKKEKILDFEKSEIASNLEMLQIFSENFPQIFSFDDFEEQKDQILNEIESQLQNNEGDEILINESNVSQTTMTLMKLSYLLCQYYPIQSENIKNQFQQVILQQLDDWNLYSQVARQLQQFSSDIPLAVIAIRLGFKDWEIEDITNQAFINFAEDQDQLLNAYEFHQQIWQSQSMIEEIRDIANEQFQSEKISNDLTVESFKLILQVQMGIDKTNPEWGFEQSSNSLMHAIQLYYLKNKELFPTKLQLLCTLSLVGFCRLPSDFSQEIFHNNINNEDQFDASEQSQTHLQSTLFQMLPGQGITTCLQIVALLLSSHGFEVTLAFRGDLKGAKDSIENIMNDLECKIEIKSLEQVILERKVFIDNQNFIDQNVRNNRVLIVEQFDSIVDIAENKTETFEIIKDTDLDQLLNQLWKIKDLPFDQEYLRNEISYISLLDKCSQRQKEQLDREISEIVFDMRTCELADSIEPNSGYREYFIQLSQKPKNKQVIKDFEIKLKIKEVKNNELLTSHFSCILGTYQTQLDFLKEHNIKNLFKIKHIINQRENSLRGNQKEENLIKTHDSSNYQTQIQKLIKSSDASVLILNSIDEIQEISEDLKPHLKYISHSETVYVQESTILVITIDQIECLLPLIKDKKLRFLLKEKSKLLFLRTCFFTEAYYQRSLLHERIDHIFKDFSLQKYFIVKESDIVEDLNDQEIVLRVQQKNVISQKIDRKIPRWTEDWRNICKINFVIENPSKEFMNTDLIPTLQKIISNAENSFIKVTISNNQKTSRAKLISTNWESDFKTLQVALRSLNLSQQADPLPTFSFDAMVKYFREVKDQVKDSIERSSPVFLDTQIVFVYQSPKTMYDDHILNDTLHDEAHKVTVIRIDSKPHKFEESSLIDMGAENEEIKQDNGGNLFVKIAKSINFKVNSMVTPGGDNEYGVTPGGPPSPIQHVQQHQQMDLIEDQVMEEQDDFMSMVARANIKSLKKKTMNEPKQEFSLPPPKEMMKANQSIQKINVPQYQEEEKKMPAQKPMMMMSAFETKRKIKEIQQNIEIINEKVCRLSNDKYYFRNAKSLFVKILEILMIEIDHFNIYDRENAILSNIPEGMVILERIGFQLDLNNGQNMVLQSYYKDEQIIQAAIQHIQDAIDTIEVKFEGR